MAQRGERSYPDNERTIYIRFPCYNSELDERVVKKLFAQFGGFSKLVMHAEKNFAFGIYDSPEQALYVCEMLNGIQFMNGTLTVKPRDNTANAELFRRSPYSRPSPQNPVSYNQLQRVQFENFNPSMLLSSKEENQGQRDY